MKVRVGLQLLVGEVDAQLLEGVDRARVWVRVRGEGEGEGEG